MREVIYLDRLLCYIVGKEWRTGRGTKKDKVLQARMQGNY